MRSLGEIVLPETKPATEWILDRPVQKMSPTRKHGVLQLAFGDALKAWGAVWTSRPSRSRVALPRVPPGEDVHPLVPDVADMSYDRLRPLSASDRDVPSAAPEIVVEILSPDDRKKDIDEKRRVYFAWFVRLELIADPDTRTVEVYDCEGRHEHIDGSLELFSPGIIPDLQLPLRAMFAEMDIPPL